MAGGPSPSRVPASARLAAASSSIFPARFTLLAGGLPIAVILVWAAAQGGYAPTTWYPGALFLLALATVAAVGSRWRMERLPTATRVALIALAAYTAWSYASIAWAGVPGMAWDGANRTLLYLVIFALFAVPNLHGNAAYVLGAWTLVLIALAVAVLLALPGSIGSAPVVLGPGLTSPVGYSNAEAALWLMAVWPALVLAAHPGVRPWLRGIYAGGAVVLVDTSVLSESRGSLIAAAVVLLLSFVLVSDRVDHLLRLVPVAATIALTVPHALHVANAIDHNRDAIPRLGTVAEPVLLGAGLLAVLVTIAGLFEIHPRPPEQLVRRARRSLAVAVTAMVAGGGLVAIVHEGGPVTAIQHAWRSFAKDPTPQTGTAGHLTAGLGGARYDYYRVALDVFLDHPLIGIGADNFAEYYLAEGRSSESPTYPHSVELRVLLQTGLIGAALFLIAIIAALRAAIDAIRRTGAHHRAVAAGATLVFLYWLIHGSVDWLWEFPALGGAAFAMLGLAAGMAPRPRTRGTARAPRPSWLAGALAAGALASLGSLAFPWLSDIEVNRASADWLRYPATAMRQLRLASALNPLSERPALVQGSIQLRLGQIAAARRSFAQALGRDPRNAYAMLELGAIASRLGEAREADRLLARAVSLNPDDAVTVTAYDQARAGHRIDLAVLNDEIANQATALLQ